MKKASIIFALLFSFQWTSDALSELHSNPLHLMFLAEASGVREIPELNLENVKKELERQQIQHADIVLRQVIVETGWLKCTHCSLQNNNIFGFMTSAGYLKFEDWTEGVAYYKRWQDKYYKGGDYYDFLDRIGYARPAYTAYLKSLY
jgi:hypothetical protein